MNIPIIRRQISASKKQSFIFVLCVMLSIISIVALKGFNESINRSVIKDARTLHGGDIIIRSNQEHSKALSDAVREFEKKGLAKSARYYEFYSVVRTADEKKSLLSQIKVVEAGYPFYGKLQLKSGINFANALVPGTAVAEQALLDRLGLKIGDPLILGSAALTIQDVVTHEPDRPLNFFSMGPRIFVSAKDLARLDLVKKGSRVSFVSLLKIFDEKDIENIVKKLENIAEDGLERVDTPETARSRIKRSLDNFFFFLNLISVFTLLLAGIGIQNTLSAFLREQQSTIAIMKALGATSRFIIFNYLKLVSVLGFIGTILGLFAGFGLQYLLPVFFSKLLPQNFETSISWHGIIEGILLGMCVSMLFSFLPLYRLKNIRPSAIFRKERAHIKNGIPYYLSYLGIFLFFCGMVLWLLKDIKTGLYFMGGVLGLILFTAFITRLILTRLKKISLNHLSARQSIRSLFRPGNATQAVIVTLAAAIAGIFSIYLIENNLDAAFVRSYPEDAPNLYFIDIQPDQIDDFSNKIKEFSKITGAKAQFYPIIRARLISINDEKINREREHKRRGDNLSRTFSLTYRSYLLKDERLLKGKTLFMDDWEDAQVSVLDTVAEIKNMKIGDRLIFKIQGIPLEAKISSIRMREKETLTPYFYFVFQEKILKDAPQSIFSAVRVEKQNIAEIQNQMASAFPNLSVIDLTETIADITGILHKLSNVIRFFTFFSIAAGLLILISSVFATRFARTQEAVYYKILGAKNFFVASVFALENIFIGFISAGLAWGISEIGSRIICLYLLDISYKAFWMPGILMVAATIFLVVMAGMLLSIPILKQKPAVFLREQGAE